MNRIIEVTLSPAGETKIETRGFAGATCGDASSYLEQALGARINERLTADFYQKQPERQRNQEGQA